MFDFEKDYTKDKTIWMFWTGDNEMSPQRRECYEQFSRTNHDCNVRLVTAGDVEQLPNIHEGYEYLSEIQKGDYLKSYFLYHFGGGYSDVKRSYENWTPYFNRINQTDDIYAIGYGERHVDHVAYLEGCRLDPKKSKHCRDFTLDESGQNWSSRYVREGWRKLIGNGAYICKKGTPLVKEWWLGLTEKMDGYLPELKQHPSKWPRDSHNHTDPNTGEKSKYPIPWAVICGNIFHPLVLKYSEHVNQDLPYPDMSRYL